MPRDKYVGTQSWVASQFSKGLDGVSQTRNFRAEGEILWHYSTIEAFRDKKGKVVSNSDCYEKGFAHCTNPDHVDFRIHLDKLATALGGYSISEHTASTIEMLVDDNCLVTTQHYSPIANAYIETTWLFKYEKDLDTKGVHGSADMTTIEEYGKPETVKYHIVLETWEGWSRRYSSFDSIESFNTDLSRRLVIKARWWSNVAKSKFTLTELENALDTKVMSQPRPERDTNGNWIPQPRHFLTIQDGFITYPENREGDTTHFDFIVQEGFRPLFAKAKVFKLVVIEHRADWNDETKTVEHIAEVAICGRDETNQLWILEVPQIMALASIASCERWVMNITPNDNLMTEA